MAHQHLIQNPLTNTANLLNSPYFSQALRSLSLGSVFLTGCEKPTMEPEMERNEPIPARVENSSPQVTTFVPSTINTSGRPVVETLDPSKLLLKNEGYLVDMNGDSRIDHTILDGRKVIFRKGLDDGQFAPPVQIAQLDADVIAYRIDTLPNRGIVIPSLIFFDSNNNGYVQENRGSREDGSPILLDPESMASSSDFDF